MLSNYVPPFLYESESTTPKKILYKIYNSQQAEIDTLNNNNKDIINQCFVNTATWGLDIWENELGIVTNTQKTYVERRNKILSKIRMQSPVTKTSIESIAKIFAETTNVILHNEEYWFEIDLETHSGFTNFLDDLMEALEELKPAHLGVRYKLTSIKEYQSTQYAASTLVSAKHYQLSSDFNYSYSPSGCNNVASKIVSSKQYQLTNNIDVNYLVNGNDNIASNLVKTIRYELS